MMLFFRSLLVISSFFIGQVVFAYTVIDNDIVEDTVWTKEMSPIVLERPFDEVKEGIIDIYVINGAQLTIEPGVTIALADNTSLKVVQDCLKGFQGNRCIEEEFASIIAQGTENEPIVFTSKKDIDKASPEKGDWGGVYLQSPNNIFEHVHLRYGGSKASYSTLFSSKSITLRNVVVEKSGGVGVVFYQGEMDSIQVNDNADKGVLCKVSCVLKNSVIRDNEKEGYVVESLDKEFENTIVGNFIANNGADAVLVNTRGNVNFQNNFIHGNVGVGLNIFSQFAFDLSVKNNFFSHNIGGGLIVPFPRSNITIANNNFLENQGYAINQRSEGVYGILPTPANWYGVDSGPVSELGKYYVSPGFDVSDFEEEGYDFSFENVGAASEAYLNYIKTKKIDTKVAEVEVERQILSGSDDRSGSLLRYDVYLENIQTKRQNNVVLNITFPKDQSLLLCSVEESSIKKDYRLESACRSSGDGKYKNGKLYWEADYPALKGKYLSFVTVLLPGSSGNAKTPILSLTNEQGTHAFDYDLGVSSVAHYETEAKSVAEQEAASDSKLGELVKFDSLRDRIKERRKSTYNLSPKSLAEKFKDTPALSENTEWEKYPLATRKAAYALIQEWNDVRIKPGALVYGKMSTEVRNDLLYFFLEGEDGKRYKMINNAAWYDLVEFIRSDNKNKRIAVFGEYYTSQAGDNVGVRFTKFEVAE